ncbi:MAG: DNA polymerase III subunit delta' [Alphaproteobacteria bacterium]|nr:DNA polymerase III subunit delta' [Alphaproteobacteria bacterium]
MSSEISPLDPAANPELKGHDQAIGTLEQALASGRLPHGWLFHGRRGIGKATLAYRFARVLLAGDAGAARPRPGLDLESDHPVFAQVAGRHHPDLAVIEAERDPKTGKIKPVIPVDRVRAATARLHSTAAISERRVLIVDGAELLNRNAANALLKPLEEPPAGAVLILVSHRPGRVAATLRSRCAKLAMHGLDEALLIDLLARHAPDLAEAVRPPIIAMARGSLGRALELAGGDWLNTYEKVVTTLAADPPDALALDELASALAKWSAKDGFPAVMDLIQTVFGRIAAHATDRGGPPLFVGEESSLSRLATRQGLDRWGGLWEKVGRLSAAVDGLNLDHAQALAQILSAMAKPPEAEAALPFVRATSSLGGALLGESL